MGLYKKLNAPADLLNYISDCDIAKLNPHNFIDYLNININKQRKGMAETLGIECYTLNYLGNLVAENANGSEVILSDGKRNLLGNLIKNFKTLPSAVFMTCMSSNFPTAVAITYALNHGKIPVLIGGIHVSTSPRDVETYIKKFVPFPELVSQVIGPGDRNNIREILDDLKSNSLKNEYHGKTSIENGVWGNDNIGYMEPHKLTNLRRIPLIGKTLENKITVNSITPYLGCPYRCNFCSISSMPNSQKKFTIRDENDFIKELEYYQRDGVNSHNRFFFFLPDNLLLGGNRLHKILDGIIYSKLKINFAAQISIDVAKDGNLLKKLRRAGATHFFIGLETLDMRNLEYIEKHIIGYLKKSKISVKEYYKQCLQKIQKHGISVHGSFIFGLPYDYYNNIDDHTGIDIAEFCIDNHIGLQACSLTDLPGSINFKISQEKKTYLYGEQGSLEYLVGLCLADLTETNRIPFDSLQKSPLLIFFMAYQATQMVCSLKNATKNAFHSTLNALLQPTKNGRHSLQERIKDSLWAFAAQLSVSQYKDHAEMIAYTKDNVAGSFERLYNNEKNENIKKILKPYIKQFILN